MSKKLNRGLGKRYIGYLTDGDGLPAAVGRQVAPFTAE